MIEKGEYAASEGDHLPHDNDDKKTKALRKKWAPTVIVTGLIIGLAVLVIVLAVLLFAKNTKSNEDEYEDFQESELLKKININLDNSRVKTDANYRLQIVRELLDKVPLIDGHNDLAMVIRAKVDTEISRVDFTSNLAAVWKNSHTDIPRLREGKVGGQFWSIYIDCVAQYKDAVQQSLIQIDLIKSMIRRHLDVFQLATTAKDVLAAHSQGKIASLLGMEGGHMMGESLAVLRQQYDLGVRYLTLTHNCHTPWADSCYNPNITQTPINGGLTEWGKLVVREMNRMGMIIDLSHVAETVMADAIDVTSAPVMFSHSSAYSLCPHCRNVPDHILRKVKENNGVVMVNFYPSFLTCTGDKPLDEQTPTATLADVADHIDYIKQLIGTDHLGIGADFDGITTVPEGLEDVSKYPDLFAELLRRGWQIDDLAKLAGYNVLRVLRDVEKVKDSMQDLPPQDKAISYESIPNRACMTNDGFDVNSADPNRKKQEATTTSEL